METRGGVGVPNLLVLLLLMAMTMPMSDVFVTSAGVLPLSHNDHYRQDSLIRRNLLANGLGITPPMGWNSWNHFNCKIDENIVKETADALVSTGLAKLGYKYVNIDMRL